MLDKAFELLHDYKWGDDPAGLAPIDEAIVASQEDASARRDLEDRLMAILASDATRNGKDVACRKLKVIGTDRSVPLLAAMLHDENHSHMARYALQSTQGEAAGQALRNALSKVSGKLQIGVISSIGARKDNDAVAALGKLLSSSDAAVARAAALALGAIESSEAANALARSAANPAIAQVVQDATLACAENLLAQGNKGQAMVIYQRVSTTDCAKHVKLAATRGMLACAGS